MSTITIPGWSSTDRIPRVVFALAFGQAARSPGAAQDYALFVGSRAYDSAGTVAQGTATDAEPEAVYSAEHAATLWGYGSEIHRIALAWFEAYPNSPAYGVSAAKGAGVRGTLATVLTVPPTSSGTMTVEIAGTGVDVYIAANAALDDIGADLAAAINGRTELPVLATYASGSDTLTLTAKCFGVSGNSIKVRTYNAPGGLTLTPASGNIGATVPGTLEPVWSDAYAAAFALDTVFYHIVPSTNLAATLNAGTGNLRTRIKDNLAPTVGKLMDAFIGHTGALADAQTLNDGLDLGTTDHDEPGYWFTLAWAKTNYVEPWFLAAQFGGTEAAAEASNPVLNWVGLEDGPTLDLVPPTPLVSNYPTETELNDAIAYGISPCRYSHKQTSTKIVTAYTSKHLIGSANDPSYLEHPNVRAVSRLMSYGLRSHLAATFSGFNVTDDVEGAPPDRLPARTTCPALTRQTILTFLRTEGEANGYLQKVTEHEDVTTVERDSANSGRLLYEAPFDVPRWVDAIGGFHREIGR